MDCESYAEEESEQRGPAGAEAGTEAGMPPFEAVDREKENISGDAALPRVEDATSKVSTPPFVPYSQPFAQHLAPCGSTL